MERLERKRPSCIWKSNIKMDLYKVGCRDMDWIDLAQDRDSWLVLVNVVIILPVP